MSCRWCKIAIGALIIAALTAAVAAMVSSGGGAMPIWVAFVKWIVATLKLSIEGNAALRVFGYKLFTFIMALGATLVYVLADVIDWFLCFLCSLFGSCSNCKTPTLNPKP